MAGGALESRPAGTCGGHADYFRASGTFLLAGRAFKIQCARVSVATRNGRPPSSNKVVEYQLWPILDAINVPRCGLHAFRHSVASLIIDAGYAPEVAQQQLRHSDARTTLGYIHFRAGITEKAMADVSNSLKLDAVGREQGKGSQYIQ